MTMSIRASEKRVRDILEEWDSNFVLAHNLKQALRNPRAPVGEGSLKALGEISRKLHALYENAVLIAENEDKVCKYFSYEKILLGTTRALDYGFQLLTTGYLAAVVFDDKEDKVRNCLIAGAATIGSMGTTWVRTKLSEDLLAYLKTKALLENIIGNRLALQQLDAEITIIQTQKKMNARRVQKVALTSRTIGTRSLHQIVTKVIETQVKPSVQFRKQYIETRFCGRYAILSSKEVEELTSRYKKLRQLIISLEEVIRLSKEQDSRDDSREIFAHLEGLLHELERIFSDASQLIVLYEDLEKSRGQYLQKNFRITLQLFLEVGSLVGTVYEGVSAYSNSSSLTAKTFGLALYVTRSVISFAYAKITGANEVNIATYQQIRRLLGEESFLKDIHAIVVQRREELKLSDMEQGLPFVSQEKHERESPPLLGAPGSPLRERILQLYKEAHTGAHDHDLVEYMQKIEARGRGLEGLPADSLAISFPMSDSKSKKLKVDELYLSPKTDSEDSDFENEDEGVGERKGSPSAEEATEGEYLGQIPALDNMFS
jgi:hypothetical protein